MTCSLLQLFIVFIFILIEEYFMENKQALTPENLEKLKIEQNEQPVLLMKKGEGEQDLPKVDKGKHRAPVVVDDNDDLSSTEIKNQENQENQEQEQQGHLETEYYYPSDYSYSVVDTNTVNSDDEGDILQEKLSLQELDKKLKQEKIDQDLALKMQQEFTLKKKTDSSDLIEKVDKVSSNLNKELEKLNSFFSSETEQASSSKTTEQQSSSSKEKDESHKKHKLESSLENTDNKKTKKR